MNRFSALIRNKYVSSLAWGLLAVAAAYAAGFELARLAFAEPVSPGKPARDEAFRLESFGISRAASVYVSPRGQDYFGKKRIPRILALNGIDLTRGALSEKSHDSGAIRISKLPKDIRPKVQMLREVMDEWLGYRLRNPRLRVTARKLGYELKDLDVGLRFDPKLTQELGDGGIVAQVSITIPELKAFAGSICGYDRNNTRLFGKCRPRKRDADGVPVRFKDGFGVYNPWVRIGGAGEPLRISVPIRVAFGPTGSLKLEVLKVDTNLRSPGLDIDMGYDRELLIPDVKVTVGDRDMWPDRAELAKALGRKERELIRLGIYHLSEFVREDLPAQLNSIALDKLKMSFEAVKLVAAPGSGFFEKLLPLQWALRPSSIGMHEGFVHVDLDSFVHDIMQRDYRQPKSRILRDRPRLAGMPRDDYDFALAINLDVINRIIDLAYTRGQLANLRSDDGSGETLHIARPPYFGVTDSGGKGRLHMTAEYSREGIKQWYALKNPYEVESDVVVRVEPVTLHSFHLVIDHVDRDTAYVPSRFVDHAAGSVADTVRSRVDAKNALYAATTTYLTDDPIELPSDVLGMPVVLLKGEFDRNGYLVLYLAYGERS